MVGPRGGSATNLMGFPASKDSFTFVTERTSAHPRLPVEPRGLDAREPRSLTQTAK